MILCASPFATATLFFSQSKHAKDFNHAFFIAFYVYKLMSTVDELDNLWDSLECDLTPDVKLKIEGAIGQLLIMIQEKHTRDKMELQKELLEKNAIERENLYRALSKRNEELQRDMMEKNEKSRKEKLDLLEKKSIRMMELHEDLLFVKKQLRSQIGKNLQAQDKCNVRGALEFIMAQMNVKTLDKLKNKPGFSQKLENVCKNNKFRFENVSHCLSDLYHKASKDYYHGINDISVIISKNSWEADEILALGLIFDEFHIPFIFYNEEGILHKYPYKLPPSYLQYFY